MLAWEPHRIDWWASGIQSIGTVYFNISTGFALVTALNATQVNRVVWRPDAVGSICFLVASALAWAEVSNGRLLRPLFTLSGWIAMLNLLGSVAFGVSAIAAKVVSGSGAPRNVELVNLGTFAARCASSSARSCCCRNARRSPQPSRPEAGVARKRPRA